MTGFGFDSFNRVPIEFLVPFAIILGIIVVMIVKGIATWNKNNHSPRLTVDAVVVAKREHVSRHHDPVGGDITGMHGYHTSSSTWYYATFEFEGGDRLELQIDGEEYGMLAEGDKGKLTFQGTRFVDFERL